MPTKREREYYAMGYRDGFESGNMGQRKATQRWLDPERRSEIDIDFGPILTTRGPRQKKRKLSAWNKFVKANSKKPRFRYRNGKLNLKKMAVAFRKTPQGKKKRR